MLFSYYQGRTRKNWIIVTLLEPLKNTSMVFSVDNKPIGFFSNLGLFISPSNLRAIFATPKELKHTQNNL